MRGSGTHHHLRQRVLRLERALDPHGPRFENAGLWRKGGGEVQLRGKRDRIDAHARAKVRARHRGMMQTNGARAHVRIRSSPR